MKEGTHVPTLPTDEDLRALARQQTPAHLDGFWGGLEASLRKGAVSPLRRASRRRAWLVPAAAAAAVATVVGGSAVVRAVTADQTPLGVLPAGPASAPADPLPENPFAVERWEDLDPGTEYFLGSVPPGPFSTPPGIPGDVTHLSFFVDGAGRHAVVLSAETEVRDTEPSGARVVTLAAHATLATLTGRGWVVTNRLTLASDPGCVTPRAEAGRPYPFIPSEAVSYGPVTVDRPVTRDGDGDGWAEIWVTQTAQCDDGDVTARVAVLDGPDTYALLGTVAPDIEGPLGIPEGEVEVRRPPAPVAEPAPGAWPHRLHREARDIYDLSFGDVVPVE